MGEGGTATKTNSANVLEQISIDEQDSNEPPVFSQSSKVLLTNAQIAAAL